jgi:Tol biopolymer transport system component
MLRNVSFSVPSKDFAVSDTGTLVYVPGSDVNALTTLALVDQDGKTVGLGLPPQHYVYPRLSPNGQQIAVETDDGKEAFISIYDLKTKGPLRRLTIGGHNSLPLWTPDSRYVTFQSDRDGDLAIFRQLADGSGAAERLTRPEQGQAQEPESWSPDGKVLAFDQAEGGNQGIWTVEPAADSKPKEFHDLKDSVQKHSDFSPDGHWIAYMSTELNRYSSQVFVKPFPPNDTTYQISTEAGRTPRWSADGKRLFYHDPNSNHLVMVDIHTQPSFSFGKPIVIPIEGTIHPQAQRNYDVTPDGRLLVVLPASSVTNGADASIARTPQINVVLNWFTELQQRVPVKQ